MQAIKNKPNILAREVIKRVRQGKKINMQELQIKAGYSPSSAKSMKGVNTKHFQDTVTPVIEKMKLIHVKALDNILERDYKKERMDSVVNVARQMVHDTQLLQGKSTENVATNVVVYGSDDFLATQINNNVK